MLTENQIEQYISYRRDPIQFILDNVKIITQKNGRISFPLYDFQKNLIKKYCNKHNLIILKSRQVGASTIVQALALWSALHFSNYNILIVSAGARNAKKFLKKIKQMFRALPQWYIDEFLPPTSTRNKTENGTKDNESEMAFTNGSTITALPATEQASRGESISLLILDEAAHTENVENVYKAIYPTISKAVDTTSKKPYGILIISTPNGMAGTGEWYYNMYQNSVSGKNNFYPLRVHWSSIPDCTKEWYLENCKALNWDQRAIRQELELSFEASGDTYIPGFLLEKIEIEEPIKKLEDNNLWIWQEPIEKRPYVIGVDTAYGTGNDDSAFQIIDGYILEQVAEFACDTIIPDDYVDILLKYQKIYNNAWMNVERNALGKIIIDKLLRIDPTIRGKLFRDGNPNDLIDQKHTVRNTKQKKKAIQTLDYGTNLTGETRNLLLTNMKNTLLEKYSNLLNVKDERSFEQIQNSELIGEKQLGIIKSERLLMQFLTFIYDKHGRVAGARKDDLVLSYGHTLWAFMKLKDLLRTDIKEAFNSLYGNVESQKIQEQTTHLLKKYSGIDKKYNLSDEELEEILQIDSRSREKNEVNSSPQIDGERKQMTAQSLKSIWGIKD